MTRVMLTDHRDDRLVSITWDDGKLYGPPEVVQMIEGLAKFYAGQPIGHRVYDGAIYNHLSDPYAAYTIMNWVFSDYPTLRGDLLKMPDPAPRHGAGNMSSTTPTTCRTEGER